MHQRVRLRWLERSLLIVGLLFSGLWFKNDTAARTLHSSESETLEAARLEAELIGPPARRLSTEAWLPSTLERGVFGRIEIPRLGISALITEGTGPAQLERAVGHISTTAFPGQAGNCALAGHRDSFLRGLDTLCENDVIRIATLQGTYTYEVEWGTVVGPHRADVLDSTASPSLTLVTCYPFHVVGPSPERFVVRARLVEPMAWSAR
jgi:LPXTG-site transpeptidase (sortase) family protein